MGQDTSLVICVKCVSLCLCNHWTKRNIPIKMRQGPVDKCDINTNLFLNIQQINATGNHNDLKLIVMAGEP